MPVVQTYLTKEETEQLDQHATTQHMSRYQLLKSWVLEKLSDPKLRMLNPDEPLPEQKNRPTRTTDNSSENSPDSQKKQNNATKPSESSSLPEASAKTRGQTSAQTIRRLLTPFSSTDTA